MTSFIVNEASTGVVTGTLKDEAGVRIAGDDLLTATYTLYDFATRAIINSRDGVSILNENGATISSASGTEGDFEIPLSVIDNAILNSTLLTEKHVVMVRFTTINGIAGSKEVSFLVKNLVKIT